MENRQKIFAKRLLRWHRRNFLRFPWRETKNPYKILLAEMLLRKTTRNQVNKIFRKLVKKYPNPKALAEADTSELEGIIEPLGMQKKRSPLLIRVAGYLLEKHRGKIPMDVEELKRIPGVGEYTANAVLCLACNKPLPLVDTNTIRVVGRVFQVKSKKIRARADQNIWSFVESLLPKNKGRELNLAMLDFANIVCRPKLPKCHQCSIEDICSYPQKTPAPADE